MIEWHLGWDGLAGSFWRELRLFIGDDDVAWTAVVGTVLALLVAVPLSRRWNVRWFPAMSALSVTAVVGAFTLLSPRGYAAFGSMGDTLDMSGLDWWRDGWGDVRHGVFGDTYGALNILLFIPFAFVWRLVTGWTIIRTIAVMALVSFAIETYQALSGFRAADPADLVANTIGAVVGSLAVSAWQRVVILVRPTHAASSDHQEAMPPNEYL